MQDTIRNFSIIAHIDHGKTTLTDQFLRLTHTVSDTEKTERIMDSNPIEQERGITIKLAPARMEYKGHTLNLIDTPGHVDFGYEVSRSLAACEGSLLVVDATQGIQAQTLSDAIIQRVPAPSGNADTPLRALLITSHYDAHKGAIGLVRVVDGELTKQKLHFLSSGVSFSPIEIGVFSPNMEPVTSLRTGEVGYIATGLKDIRTPKIGDTVTSHHERERVAQLPGYREPIPMDFMEL